MRVVTTLPLLVMVAVTAGCTRPAPIHMTQRAEAGHLPGEPHAHAVAKPTSSWAASATSRRDRPVLVSLRQTTPPASSPGVAVAKVLVSAVNADLSWYGSGSALPDGEGSFTLALPLPTAGDYVLFLEHGEGDQRIASVASLSYAELHAPAAPLGEAAAQPAVACPLHVMAERDSSGAIQVACQVQDGVASVPSSAITVSRALIVSRDGGRGAQIAPLASNGSDAASDAVRFTRVHAQPGAYRVWVAYEVAGRPTQVAQDIVVAEVPWKDRPWWETTSHKH